MGINTCEWNGRKTVADEGVTRENLPSSGVKSPMNKDLGRWRMSSRRIMVVGEVMAHQASDP